MDCRITGRKITLQVSNVVSVLGNHFDNDRTELYYDVVFCLIHDDQARINWSIFLTTDWKIEMLK